MNKKLENIAVIYSAPKIGDVIWQLPYVKAISNFRKKKIFLYIHKSINLKEELELLKYIYQVKFSGFNRGKKFLKDMLDLKNSFKKNSISEIYLLEKTKCAVMAAFLAGVKKRISYGIGLQKIFLTNKNFLNVEDLKMNYPSQSDKFLKINNIPIYDQSPELPFKKTINNKILSITLDSLEDNRIWPKQKFAELIQKIIEDNFFKKINIISHPNKSYLAKYVMEYNNFNYNLVDCSQLSFEKIIKKISESSIFLSNDTGPANAAAAFGIPTIVIIGPTDASALRSKNMIKIKSKIYNKSRELGIKRHGDNFDKSNTEISTIEVDEIYNTLKKLINRIYAT